MGKRKAKTAEEKMGSLDGLSLDFGIESPLASPPAVAEPAGKIPQCGSPDTPDDGFAQVEKVGTTLRGRIRITPEPIFKALGMDDTDAIHVVYDIETGPRGWDDMQAMVEPFSEPPPFDPSSVKTGDCDRLNDKAEAARRKAEKINMARAAYESAASKAKQEYVNGIIAESLLNPLLGRILAIGYGWRKANGEEVIVIDGLDDCPESDMIIRFWNHVLWARQVRGKLGGHGIREFDVPWCMRRGMQHMIELPRDLLYQGRYLDRMFVDSMEAWGCGVWNARFVSADELATYFGTRRKVQDEVKGETFHVYWNAERDKAIRYLTGDIACELDLCDVMGLWS